MSNLACYFLGPFRVTMDDAPVTAFESAKVRALLAYLAIEATRPHERDTLAALFWPEQPDSAARQNLRQALYQLNQTLNQTLGKSAALPTGTPPTQPFLLISRRSVQLNPQAPVVVDVQLFRLLIAQCEVHGHDAMQTCAECAERLQKATELFKGELLEGFSVSAGVEFDEWYMCERESLNRGMHKALSCLAAYHEGLGQDERALLYTQWQTRLEPWREEVYRQSMHLLARMGQRSAALAQYETCRRVLAQELAMEPARETTSLYERILGESDYVETAEQAILSNLPISATRFIGREAEVTAVEELLSRPDVRILCVTGPGGVGKTRVAVQAAHSLTSRFSGGVLFADLSPISKPGYVATQIGGILGVEETAGRPWLEGLAAKLHGRELLLLLDNFEQVVAAAPFLVDLVKAAPGLKLLVTSRIALPLRSAHEYPLPQMALPDAEQLPRLDKLVSYEAVRLFTERAAARKPDFAVNEGNAQAVVEVCRRLDGLPLALELAAARIKVLTPQAMLTRLTDRLKLLDSQDGDVPLRHRTMRNAIAWSYDLLSLAEQAVFRRLSVFSGGWTLEAAQEVAGRPLADGAEEAGGDMPPDVVDVVDVLEALADKSLVRYALPSGDGGEARYTMLETVREYAVERALAAGEREALQALHAAYFLRVSEEALRQRDAGSANLILSFEQDHANLQAALLWLLSSAEESAGVQPAAQLITALGRFWDLRGYWSLGRRWIEMLLSHPACRLLPASLHAEVLSRAGWLALRQSDLRPAEQYLGASLLLFEGSGHLRVALVLNGLGVAALYGGDYEKARAYFEQGLEQTSLEAGIVGGTYHLTIAGNLATAALFQGDYARAKALAETVLQAGERGVDVPAWDLAQTSATLGVVLLMEGELTRAGSLLAAGMEGAWRLGYTLMLLFCLCGYAAVLGAAGEATEGARLFGAFDANSKRLGWPMSSGFQALYSRVTTPVRSSLSPEEWAQAYNEGYSLALDEAVEQALLARVAPPIARY